MAAPSVPGTEKPRTQLTVFVPALMVCAAVAACFIEFPEATAEIAGMLKGFITSRLGWLFLLCGLAALIFCGWLALSRHGNIVLGPEGEAPEYGTLSWVAMMFTAGIGAGTVAWAFAEPVYYLQTPPFGIAPFSQAAYEWAHTYPMFHWGLIPWAFYALPAVPIAYSLYVDRAPYLRLSETCTAGLPETGRAPLHILIDVFIIFGIVGGTATSLGLGVPLVSALLSSLTGFENTDSLKIGILIVWVLVFGASTIRGLKRGIQSLAKFNMLLAGLLLLVIFAVGPTLFILDMSVNSMGAMVDSFFRMATWTDPVAGSSFPEDWTVFYWAWWMAFSAFVGLFIARISRGRTIRQLVLGTVFLGSLGTVTFMSICGGYSLHLQQSGALDTVEILSHNGGLYALTAEVAANLPFATLSLSFFIVLCIIFYATTMDSAAYIAASISSKNLRADQEPRQHLRFAWISIIFLFTLGMVYADNVSIVQSITIIGAVPLIPILISMCVSFVSRLNHAEAASE